MKKVLPLLLFVALIMVGCSLGNEKEIKIGTIKYLNVTEEMLNEILIDNRPSLKGTRHKYLFFDNLNAMIAGLKSGQVDEISIYQTVALYLNSRNSNVQWEISEPIVSDMFCCAMREKDTALREEFNGAILTISQDGTLAKLVKNYLDESTHGKNPQVVEMPTFYNEPTIKIGVTGDLPLLDYIRPDGQPAGFNTAVLAEISRHIKKNFVLVQIDSGARAAALSSGHVDAIFWAVSPKSPEDKLPQNFDTPEGMILTMPYFSDDIVHVKLMK